MARKPYKKNDGGKPILLSGQRGEEFKVKGHRAFVILPPMGRPDRKLPWVWYAPTLPDLPTTAEDWMFQKFLDAGLAIAGIDVGESFGSPQGRALYTALYDELVTQMDFSTMPCLLARSRGGLMLYNWAVEHPGSVACIAGIYPVCDLRSYPGVAKACGAYGLTETELTANLAEHNPIERIAPLAQKRVPILHLHGDQDEIVPLEQNSAALATRYRQQGGDMRLIIFPGEGHNYWSGWFESPVLVEFVIAHARNYSFRP